jgi:hypothetical protein
LPKPPQRRYPVPRATAFVYQQDRALLLSFVTLAPTRPVIDALTSKDRRRLRTAVLPWMDDDLHEAWTGVDQRDDVRRLVRAMLA